MQKQANMSKTLSAAHTAEAGSVIDLTNKLKNLQLAIKNATPGNNVTANGITYTYKAAQDEAQRLTTKIKELDNSMKGINQTVKIQAGSYQELYNRQKALYDLLKNTQKGSNVTFEGRTFSYEKAIAEFKRLSAAEQAFRRQFQQDSLLIGEYSSGIVNAFKRLGLSDVMGEQITKTKERIKELDSHFNRLKAKLETFRTAGKDTSSIEHQMIANRNEVANLNTQLSNLRGNLASTGTIGERVTYSISQGFAGMKQQINQLVVSYLGFFAAFRAATDIVHKNKELSDAFSNLQIRIHGTGEDVDDLFEKLKKLDTRTSLTGLVDIANIVAKKSVTKDALVEITSALDKIRKIFASGLRWKGPAPGAVK